MEDIRDRNWGSEGMTRQPSKSSPSSVGIRLAIGALALALGCVAFYDYFALRGIRISNLPQIEQSLSGLTQRAEDTAAKLGAWRVDMDRLSERLAAVDRKVSTGLRRAERRSQTLIAQSEGRLRAEWNVRAQAIEARLAGVESKQEVERARLGQLERQLEAARQEIASLRESNDRDLTRLDRRQTADETELNLVAHQDDRQRVNFEVAKNRALELVPGISLHVYRTHADYQSFDGWVWITADHRTLWISRQGAQEPVVFYTREGTQRYDLVVNSVSETGVAGYLLLPPAGEPETRAARAAGAYPSAAGGASETGAGKQ